MQLLHTVLLAGIIALSTAAHGQQSINIRGTLTAVDGKMLSVKTRDGKDLQVELPDGVNVSITMPFSMADIKAGMALAVTTVKRADGATVAIDVRPIPPTASLYLAPYDLQPNSSMTNASVEAMVQAAEGRELLLNYKTGTANVLVLPDTPMSRSAPGNRADLVPGEAINIAARPDKDGTLLATRVQVGKNGLKPTW